MAVSADQVPVVAVASGKEIRLAVPVVSTGGT